MNFVKNVANVLCLLAVAVLRQCAYASTIQLTSGNIDSVLGSTEFVMINFYADWCHFSQHLKPVYEEMATNVRKKFPEEKVVIGKVDCEQEADLAARFQISKYPTLKTFRYGQPTKREYRGQRSAESLGNFIEEQLKNPINSVSDIGQLDSLDWHKRHVVGFFDAEQSSDYNTFCKVASLLRDDCVFHAAVGPVSEAQRVAGNKVVYRVPKEEYSEQTYSGILSDYESLQRWMTDKCVPLVREITFQNAEELTEEGLPFVILFHHPDDTTTPELLRKQVALELLSEKSTVNFLTADGLKFTHPLHHLGKTAADLPLLAIDSFQHMYLWTHDPKTDISKPGLLKQFIADLHSGKLHREFHNGPDPTSGQPSNSGAVANVDNSQHLNVEHRVIMDSGGVRVQIMRVVKIGHDDVNPMIDFGAEIENLFRAMSAGLNDNGPSNLLDGAPAVTDDSPQPPIAGSDNDDDDAQSPVQPSNDDSNDGLVRDNGKPYDIKDETTDKYWMNLIDSKVESGSEDGTETTTTVVKATHKLKLSSDRQQMSSAPPRSVFARLAPSRDRYTLLKEEL